MSYGIKCCMKHEICNKIADGIENVQEWLMIKLMFSTTTVVYNFVHHVSDYRTVDKTSFEFSRIIGNENM